MSKETDCCEYSDCNMGSDCPYRKKVPATGFVIVGILSIIFWAVVIGMWIYG